MIQTSPQIARRLVDAYLSDFLRYFDGRKEVTARHRKRAASAFVFLISDQCKAICLSIGKDHKEILSIIQAHAKRKISFASGSQVRTRANEEEKAEAFI